MNLRKKVWLPVLILSLLMPAWSFLPAASRAATHIRVDTTSELRAALVNAQPGDTILVAPGVYELTSTTSVEGRPAYFYSTADGTSASPITIESEDPGNPAVLKGGNVASPGYTLYLTGDYWVVRNVHITHGQKGIMLDHSNHTHIDGVTVYHVGQEGIHVRDGSSNVVIENSTVRDTGATGTSADRGFAEGIYIGSDRSVWDVNSPTGYDRRVYNTIVRNNTIGPGVAAESLDIKEGTSGTLIENNVFLGAGISGENFADSFIDVKGVNVTIRNNVGYRQNNSNIKKDIAEVNRTSTNPWCPEEETANGSLSNTSDGNTYTNNTFYPGDPSIPDTEPPTAPANLNAVAVSSSRINLTWTASTDNVGVAGYQVFRDGELIGTSSTPSYSDTGLAPETTYSYTVRAYDAAGNVSANSNPASATTGSGGGGGPVSSLRVLYQEGDEGDSGDKDIRPYVEIVNSGTSDIPLSELKIRYYYTKEANVPQNFVVDYAALGKSNVTGSFGPLSSPAANTYLEVGFTSGAGTLAAGSGTGILKLRIHNSDWSDYDETNDYSYDPSYTSLSEYAYITLYHNGTPVWGIEP